MTSRILIWPDLQARTKSNLDFASCKIYSWSCRAEVVQLRIKLQIKKIPLKGAWCCFEKSRKDHCDTFIMDFQILTSHKNGLCAYANSFIFFDNSAVYHKWTNFFGIKRSFNCSLVENSWLELPLLEKKVNLLRHFGRACYSWSLTSML